MTFNIDFKNSDSLILLNPSYPLDFRNDVYEAIGQLQKPSHFWVSSSGTTSQGQFHKMIGLSKSAVLASAEAVNQALEVKKNDRWIHVLPKFHVGGLGILARCHLSGAQWQDGFFEGRWKASHFVSLSQQTQATLAALVPTQVFDLVRMSLKAPPSYRAIVVGGGALNFELYRAARDLGWPLLPSYGLSEAGSQVATADLNSLENSQFENLPPLKVLSHVEVKSSPDQFLCLKGPSLFSGYFMISSATQEFLDPKREGWFQGEDRVEIQEKGLIFLGREQDFVKVGGESVSLRSLQEKLDQLTFSLKSSGEHVLLALPSERLGHEIHMASTLSETPELHHILETFNASVLPFERIKKIYLKIEIPRTTLGKVQRGLLQKKLLETERTNPSLRI